MALQKVEFQGYECKVCGHKWLPRKKGVPKWCPKCNSENWQTGRKRPPIAEQRAAAERRRELEKLLASGLFSEVNSAIAAPGLVKTLKETMIVPCGEPMEYHEMVDALGEGNDIQVRGELAELATEHSFIARADGESMNGESVDSILHGDRLLMTPLEEFGNKVSPGSIVLVKLTYKSGLEKYTLKTFGEFGSQKYLTAKNPRFKAPEFGPELKHAEVVAVCRGVVEKIFE